MSIAEIEETRSSLIAWIEQLSDTNTLFILESLKNSKVSGDWWDDLSEAQQQNINEGIKDVEEGRTVSSEEFWRILKNG
jgi:predicted transcriptional regulator